MTTFYGDLETYSEVPIKHGIYRYAEACEVMIFSCAIDDGPVRVYDFTDPHIDPRVDPRPLLGLQDAISSADEVVFQNSMFDRTVLNVQLPSLCPPLERWRDTMVQALAHSLPGGLAKLCAILNVPHDKRKLDVGKQLIQLFCKPRPKNSKIRRATRDTHPAEWARFVEYAGADVEAMREAHRKLPRWNYDGGELALWHLDQRINDRGFAVDLELINAAIRTAEREKKRLAKRTQELTGYDAETGEGVASATQRDKLLAHLLLAHGVALPDLTADTLERRLNDDELPAPVRELLRVRLQAATAGVTKYKAMLRSVNADGRIRGTLQFAGAQRTGRWSGKLVQPQNFKRTPKYLAGDTEVELAAGAIALDAADLVYPNTMETLAAGVPWAIVAAPGKKFCISDLSNIEGRVLAWLAGEEWKLAAFRHYDEDPKDKARDLYIIGYAKSFKEPIEDVIADYEGGGEKRQIGKVQELALGYQGAVGAFTSMAEVYGIDLVDMAGRALLPLEYKERSSRAYVRAVEEKRAFDLPEHVFRICWTFTQMWRAANPAIVKFWFELETAVKFAIETPGLVQTVGRVTIDRVANWLRIRLPSGRHLCYPSPRIDELTGKISYMGVNQYTRRWQRIYTYGGKLAENIDQATSRDIFGWAMPVLEEVGYPIVMHVHDEVVCEVPDTESYSADAVSGVLTANPSWADGLPLSAGGYESHRYRKD